MGVLEIVREFGALHQRMKRGQLAAGELRAYDAARERALQVLIATQPLQPGQKARHSLRAACAIQADITLHDGMVVEPTLDISSGGFAVLFQEAPRIGDEVEAVLHIPGEEPLEARALVTNTAPHGKDTRVGFRFVGLDVSDAERLDTFVLDVVLRHFL